MRRSLRSPSNGLCSVDVTGRAHDGEGSTAMRTAGLNTRVNHFVHHGLWVKRVEDIFEMWLASIEALVPAIKCSGKS